MYLTFVSTAGGIIHPPTTSLTTPLSKIWPRQVVDNGEANLTLSKILISAYFLLPKHVPNVDAILISRPVECVCTYGVGHVKSTEGPSCRAVILPYINRK